MAKWQNVGLWVSIFQKYNHSPTKKCEKNQNVKQLRFSLNTTNSSTLKIVHSKSPVHGHGPKFLFPHRYKTVPSAYDKNTSNWSSNAQI